MAKKRVLVSQKLKAKLLAVGATARSVQPALEQRMLKRTQDRFLREIDPDGKPWPPLDPATRKKEGTAGPNQILIDTGTLARSIRILKGTTANTPGSVKVPTGAGFSIGSTLPYAAVHQKGLGRVPVRRFLGIGKGDIRSMVTLAKNIMLGRRTRP